MRKIITFCVLVAIIALGTFEYRTIGLPNLSEHPVNLAFCALIVCASVVVACWCHCSKKDILISLSGGALLTVFLILAFHIKAFIPTLLDRCEGDTAFMLVVLLSIIYFECIYAGTLYLYIKYYSGLYRDIELID